MLIFLIVDFGFRAKVDADSVPQDSFAIEDLSEVHGIVDAVEADDDAAEGLERGEGVDCRMLVDCGSYAF